MRQKRLAKRVISIGLIMSLMAPLLTGCGKNRDFDMDTSLASEQLQEVVNQVSGEILDNIDDYLLDEDEEVSPFSDDWQDYVGDFETLIIGLIVNEMKYGYDVFPATVSLDNGVVVSGIGYTDYSVCYSNEEETHSYFEAGFISNCGEIDISKEEIEEGLVIENMDYQDENVDFLLAYECEPFTRHCVAYDKYVKYGIDPNGKFFYETEDFLKEKVDLSLGSLFSYDQAKYLLDTDIGNFEPLRGVSLVTEIDFSEIEEAINYALENQDKNFVQIDEETVAYFSQEAYTNYLLSLQRETFLGYDVEELIEATKKLDPMECYRISKDGLQTIDIRNSTTNQVAKWAVGAACVVVTAVGMVIRTSTAIPTAIVSAVVGGTLECFMQVVISGEELKNIDWNKVAVAVCSGAISGFLGPIAAKGNLLMDAVLDGCVGGLERTVNAWMENKSGTEMAREFGMGVALGFGLSVSLNSLSRTVAKLLEKITPKIDNALGTYSKKYFKNGQFSDAANSKLKGIAKKSDNAAVHNKYVSKKYSNKQLKKLNRKGDSELLQKSVNQLTKEKITDTGGNVIANKRELFEIADKAKNKQVIGVIKKGKEIINVVKQNGVVGIYFDQKKYQSVKLKNGLSNNRKENFLAAAGEFKEKWMQNPEEIPRQLVDAINSKGGIEKITDNQLKNIICKRNSPFVFHENIDLETITLVSRELHNAVSHSGGIAVANYLKNSVATDCTDKILNSLLAKNVKEID